MSELLYQRNEKGMLRAIIAVSVAVPLLVVVLLFTPMKLALPMELVARLPFVNAIINSLTALLLVLALLAVRRKNVNLHRQLMLGAMGLGALFLVSYVLYHASVPSVKYGDINGDGLRDAAELAAVGGGLYIYMGVLLTHILFAAIVLPFVLMAAFFALQDKIALHRKVVKFAYPLWLYVSISGVLVYWMIHPYYQF
jgi:putative membrane protein